MRAITVTNDEHTTMSEKEYPDKITAPALTTVKDGTITFVGWLWFPPNMTNPMRVTITVPPGSASGPKVVYEPANRP